MKGSSKDGALSVTELTSAIKEALEQNLHSLWIQGEISNYSSPASGHVYFTLKDENNQIKIAFFGGRKKAAGLNLEDGKKVALYGRVSIYGKRSEYQMIAEEIQVTGLGDLLLEFEKLKKKLSDEGLFGAAHKLEIPKYPQKIGIITSPTGAAVRDIINILKRRYQPVEVLIYPVMVQGAEAPGQIIRGLNDLDCLGMDVIILTRGGGSMEDLWAFNDENLARAIYRAKTPVISAVGHEIDFTIADFVSDLRAPTPSAAAELVVPDSLELSARIEDSRSKLGGVLSRMVELYRERLDKLSGSYAFKLPFQMYTDHVQRVDELGENLSAAVDLAVETAGQKTEVLEGKLRILNPLNILKKGYSVVYDNDGNIIKDSKTAAENISIALYKGRLEARVTKKTD
jgi:exodeoxyribonuclease VII large subunit